MGTPISTYRYFITTFAWQCGKVGEHKKLQTRNSPLRRKKKGLKIRTTKVEEIYERVVSYRGKSTHIYMRVYMKKATFFQRQRHLCVFMQRAPNCFGQSGKTSSSCNFGCKILTWAALASPLTPGLNPLVRMCVVNMA